MSTIGRTAGFLLVVLGVAVTAARQRPAPAPPTERTTVVAELFTSEGCSSCPAADDLLREWLATQPVPGVEVVALGEHVDYWDRLGWRDPFSSADFSARQSAYDASVFRSGRIYTPQLVIDGQLEAIGSDRAAVRRAITESATQPKAAVRVTAVLDGHGRVMARVRIDVPPGVRRQGPADVVVAVTEDGLATTVARGENGGRTLRHAAVTRSLITIGVLEAGVATVDLQAAVPLAAEWATSNLRLVAFVQESSSRRIHGGGAIRLDAPATRAGAGR